MIRKKIGLFFGSFNPIHYGHIGLAGYFVDNNYVDEVWFVVSPQNPFKSPELLSDANERVKTVSKALEKYPYFKVCDIELTMPVPSYTIDTLNKLSTQYNDNEFIILMGSDQLPNFKKWKEWETIANNYKIFVYPRNSYPATELLPSMTFFNDGKLFNISSTEIRKCQKK
jgi:nicotinate-nucleotide adenylyltransferase